MKEDKGPKHDENGITVAQVDLTIGGNFTAVKSNIKNSLKILVFIVGSSIFKFFIMQ
jgi:hypothetical protein